MHPALSVVIFTTFAGAGYGMLFLLGLLAAARHHPADLGFNLVCLILTFALMIIGLLSSTRHLKHPERAWRAFSQWRSSWLSREAVAVVLTFVPAGVFALAWLAFVRLEGVWTLFPLLSALGAVVVVACTAQIYASLRSIPEWHDPLVLPLYLAFALATGTLWVNAVTWSFGVSAPFAPIFALITLVLAWGLKLLYWRRIDGLKSENSTASATGLGRPGGVRTFDPPHAGTNYVMTEMGFQIGRRHASKLRRIALALGFLLPVLGSLLMIPGAGPLGILAAWLAAAAGLAGVVVERWLFFAEARHVVMSYYRSQ